MENEEKMSKELGRMRENKEGTMKLDDSQQLKNLKENVVAYISNYLYYYIHGNIDCWKTGSYIQCTTLEGMKIMFNFITLTETREELLMHIYRKIEEGEFEPEFIDELNEFMDIYTEKYV